MLYTPHQWLLILMMLISGSLNTIFLKWADTMHAKGWNDEYHHFNHPFFQALSMFGGELLCLVVFKIIYKTLAETGRQDEYPLTRGNRKFSVCILLPPAVFDMVASSTIFVGLNLTNASSYQMLRGAVIVFVALLSIFFLKKHIHALEWTGIFMVLAGLAVVGLSDYAYTPEQHTNTLGNLLIAAAQLFAALQFIFEEKFVTGKGIPPLQAVGWEGIFGFVILVVLHVPFYYIKVPPPFSENPRGVLEDVIDAVIQIMNYPMLVIPTLGSVFSIAFFNFAGISITQQISAMTRMVLDSLRTLLVWLWGVCFMGEHFHVMKLCGFLLLLCGTLMYNRICCRPQEQEQVV